MSEKENDTISLGKDTQLWDNLVTQCIKEYDAAMEYRAGRVSAWHENEDLYNVKEQPTLKGRSNYLLPEMPGFIDTLLSKIDDPPDIVFMHTEEADKRKTHKVTKAWEYDSSPTRGDWDFKDLLLKKQAAVYGRAIAKYIATNGKKYLSQLYPVDVYDFLIDPMAGGIDIENANYMGQDNIFKSKAQLEKHPEIYDQTAVAWVFSDEAKEKMQDADNSRSEKQSRYASLGLNFTNSLYQSESMENFTEWYTTYEGERYIVLLSIKFRKAIRVELLKDTSKQINPFTEQPYWPFASWAVYPDLYEFWTLAPADRLRPIIKSQSVLINQAIDNRNFKNYGMKGYDVRMVDDPADLEPRPQGLVPFNVPANKRIQDGFYEFTYPNLGDTSQLFNILEGVNAKHSGITPEAQGMSDNDKKVGVYKGDIQQIADRMGLFNRSYKHFYQRLGLLYFNGLVDYYTDDVAIKVLGEDGVDMETLLSDDLEGAGEFTPIIKGGSAEAQASELRKVNKAKILAQLSSVNQRERDKMLLEITDFEKEDIQRLFDTGSGDPKSSEEAAEENQLIARGKPVEPNLGANTVHIRKHILFWKKEKDELDSEVEKKLVDHIQAEIPIAARNRLVEAKMIASVMAAEGQIPPSDQSNQLNNQTNEQSNEPIKEPQGQAERL